MLELDKSAAHKALTRTRSDMGKLKTDVVDFLDEWNTQYEIECTPNTANKTCQVKKQVWSEALNVLFKPVLNLCKRHGKQSKWRSESNVRCRRSSQSVDSDQQICPLARRRAMSESSLQTIQQVKCVAEFSPERQKRVCFSAPDSSSCCKTFEKRCCPSRPRSILAHKSCIAAKPDYMDYATFKAWRRGSRLSIDVCSMPIKLKECKEKKFERVVKNFIYNCINSQMNHSALPDM